MKQNGESNEKKVRTLRSSSGCPGHSSSLQSFVITQQPSACITSTDYQRFCIFSGLTNLNDIFQFHFSNLSGWKYQLPSPTNGFGLLEFLDLGVTSGDEFCLVGWCCFSLLAIFPLTFLPLGLFFLRLAFVLEST